MLNGYANWLLYTKTVANLVESEDDLSDQLKDRVVIFVSCNQDYSY